MSGNGDLEVCNFQGNDGEEVPKTVEKLIFNNGIQEVPAELCNNLERLRDVVLDYGVKSIHQGAFRFCENLLKIRIGSTVQCIGDAAFRDCKRLKRIEYVLSTSHSTHQPTHQLATIGDQAFRGCASLSPKFVFQSSVTSIGRYAFAHCTSLVQVFLSSTGVTEISSSAFASCSSLYTVHLPKTLERICDGAFGGCHNLVTVAVPPDSQLIRIENNSFYGCRELSILALPKGSTAKFTSFFACAQLHECYGRESTDILAGLIGRFDNLSVHRICYGRESLVFDDLPKRVADKQEEGLLLDDFRMNPFHIFFSTDGPNIGLLDILLNMLPNRSLLKWKDVNDRRPLDYLILGHWNDSAKNLFQRTLQKWMIDQLVHWGNTSWIEAVKSKVLELLAEDDRSRRTLLWNGVYSSFERYESLEATSILELALWKGKLKSGRTAADNKRQALDREHSRFLSGSDIVIPRVTIFLGIREASPQDDIPILLGVPRAFSETSSIYTTEGLGSCNSSSSGI